LFGLAQTGNTLLPKKSPVARSEASDVSAR
jgi:hypothetical protein